MKTKTFNMTYDFIDNELSHKIAVGYENESKRAYEILEELQEKVSKATSNLDCVYKDKKIKFEVTEEEYQIWFVYWFDFYIDEFSCWNDTSEQKEAKRLKNQMIKFFGKPNFDDSHRVGRKLKPLFALFRDMTTQNIHGGNDTLN